MSIFQKNSVISDSNTIYYVYIPRSKIVANSAASKINTKIAAIIVVQQHGVIDFVALLLHYGTVKTNWGLLKKNEALTSYIYCSCFYPHDHTGYNQIEKKYFLHYFVCLFFHREVKPYFDLKKLLKCFFVILDIPTNKYWSSWEY